MVWPAVYYYWTFDDVVKNHLDAAELNDASVISLGLLWKRFYQVDEDAGLYGSDQFHPSAKGSQLAAVLIMYFLEKKIDRSIIETNLSLFSSQEIDLIFDFLESGD